jgi:integrase
VAEHHIDNLTGVQPATTARFRTFVARDVDPVFGSMPVSAVTETTIARWVKQLSGSGKTISNKHGFLSGAAGERLASQPLGCCQDDQTMLHFHID